MLKGLMGLAGAGVAAVTLMACYGLPPCDAPAPDGGSDKYYCYDNEPQEDGGVQDDGGMNSPDGGSDAGR